MVAVLTSSSVYGQTEFFYSVDEKKVYMDIYPNRLVLKASQELSKHQIGEKLQHSIGSVSVRPIDGLLLSGFLEIEFELLDRDIREIVTILRSDSDWTVVNPVYSINGNPLIAYDVFVVYLKDESVLTGLERLNAQYDVEMIDRDVFLPNMITLRMNSHKAHTVVEMARLYYENLALNWAVPDFKRTAVLNSPPQDTYYPYQYYLNMTSTPQARDITIGHPDIADEISNRDSF